MDRKTYTALRASTNAWKQKALESDPNEVKVGWRNCPLCELFYREYCEGCPVGEATGEPFCRNTPYEAAKDSHQDWTLSVFPLDPANPVTQVHFREQFHHCAIAEVRFLQSLVPAGGPDDE